MPPSTRWPSKQPAPAQLEDAAKQTPEREPHPTKTDCSPALQDRPTATPPIARPPLHPGTAPPTLRKTTSKIKTETSKQLAVKQKQNSPRGRLDNFTTHEARS